MLNLGVYSSFYGQHFSSFVSLMAVFFIVSIFMKSPLAGLRTFVNIESHILPSMSKESMLNLLV